MKVLKHIFLPILLPILIILSSCEKRSDGTTAPINVFSISDDIALGDRVEKEVISTQPVLDSATYSKAYGHLNRIVNTILNSGKLDHRNDFKWKVRIIKNDTTLNAFCAPGGKVFVYTGIIKYLDSEADLAGVLGHEIAHADRRHISNEMTKEYGIQTLLDIILGKNQSQLTQIATDLVFLKFSRTNEADADKMSVIYLCPTPYKADGAASFFEKLIAKGQSGSTPAFLSTHPDPGSRVSDIKAKKTELGCTGSSINTDLYADFKNSLPK